jgi:hypothetical protein
MMPTNPKGTSDICSSRPFHAAWCAGGMKVKALIYQILTLCASGSFRNETLLSVMPHTATQRWRVSSGQTVGRTTGRKTGPPRHNQSHHDSVSERRNGRRRRSYKDRLIRFFLHSSGSHMTPVVVSPSQRDALAFVFCDKVRRRR